jgi:hypothetical protein
MLVLFRITTILKTQTADMPLYTIGFDSKETDFDFE